MTPLVVQMRIAPTHILEYGSTTLTHQNVQSVELQEGALVLRAVPDGPGKIPMSIIYAAGVWSSFVTTEAPPKGFSQEASGPGAKETPPAEAPAVPGGKVVDILKDGKKDPDEGQNETGPGAA